MADGARTHFRTCHLCEAMCGIAIELEGDRIVADPRRRGRPVQPRPHLPEGRRAAGRARGPGPAAAAAAAHRRPAGRRSRGTRRSTRSPRGSRAIQRAHGRNAVAVYQGNPIVHNHGALLFGQLFQRSLGSRSRYSATSVDQLPHMLASLLMFGHQLLLPIPDVDRTDFLLVLGANPLVSNGSLMTAPGIERRLKALRARGGRLVVVDPRRTETAALADQHLRDPPRRRRASCSPRSLHTLASEDRVRAGPPRRVHRRPRARSSTPSRPSRPRRWPAATGIDAATIRALARDFAAAPAAVAYGRVGICTQEFGGLASWLVNVLNVVTGNLDRPGGAMFPAPAVDVVALADRIGQRGHFDKGRSRVRGLPEFGGEWPAAVLAEEIETPGEGQVRALVTSAGNPVLSTPNGARLDRALAVARLHGVDRPLPERDHAPRAPDPAADLRARARALRPRLPRARGAQHREVLAAALPRAAGIAPRLADPARARHAGSSERAARAASRTLAAAPRVLGARPGRRSSPCCCASGRAARASSRSGAA